MILNKFLCNMIYACNTMFAYFMMYEPFHFFIAVFYFVTWNVTVYIYLLLSSSICFQETQWLRDPTVTFLLTLLPWLANHLDWKRWQGRDEKTRAPQSSFSSGSSLPQQRTKVERIGTICTHQEMQWKDFFVSRISTFQVRTHYTCRYNLQNMNLIPHTS